MAEPTQNNRRRAWAAAALLLGLMAVLGALASNRPYARGGSDAPWARALQGAFGGVVGPKPWSQGLAPQVMEGLIQRSRPQGPSGADGAGAGGVPGRGEAGQSGEQAPCPPETPDCASAEGAGSPAALDELRRAAVKGSSQRSSAFLSSEGRASDTNSSAAVNPGHETGGGSLKEEEVAQVFDSFIKRLRQEARAQAQGRRRQGSYGASGEPESASRERNGPAGGAGGEGSPLMASPSFRNLMKAGRDTNYGVHLIIKGMPDGAKERAGKEFDGSLKTYAPIPIERSRSAFGKEVIRTRTKAEEEKEPR